MQRKPTKNTRGPNADEKRYQAWCKEQPCIVTGREGPSIVHHCEGATFKHNKVLVGHWFCIPLCEEVDNVITYGSRRKFREFYGPQSRFWRLAIEKYDNDVGCFHMPPEIVFDAIMDWDK